MRKQSIYLLATQLLSKIAEEQSFEEAIKDKKFKNSETGNEVLFSSLPAEDQKKVRAEWQKHLDKNKDEDKEEMSVEEAKEKLSEAEKVLEGRKLSDNEMKEMTSVLNGNKGLEVPPILSTVDSDLNSMVYKLTKGKTRTPLALLKNLDMNQEEQKDLSTLFGLITGDAPEGSSSNYIPKEAAVSEEGFDKWLKRLLKTFDKAMTQAVGQGEEYYKDDEYGLSKLSQDIESLGKTLKDSVESEMRYYKKSRMQDMFAVAAHHEAKEQLKKSENAAKAEKNDKADKEESKPLEEMTPQELLKEYEEMIENSNMDPKEKEQAIKSMKKKSPSDLKEDALIAIKSIKKNKGKGKGGDEEGGAGKTATLRRAGQLMAEIRMNERRIASLEQRLAGAMDKPRQLQK